jgi:L-cysteine S-thiosulfotransferase
VRRRLAVATLVAAAVASTMAGQVLSQDRTAVVAAYTVVGDQIPYLLSGNPGDTGRGRRILVDREIGNCLACHKVAETGEPFQGDLGPDLGNIGRRLTAGQIRFRLVDLSRLNPTTLMPPYHRVEGLTRVATKYADNPVLTAQEIEDVVAYLTTLRQ